MYQRLSLVPFDNSREGVKGEIEVFKTTIVIPRNTSATADLLLIAVECINNSTMMCEGQTMDDLGGVVLGDSYADITGWWVGGTVQSSTFRVDW